LALILFDVKPTVATEQDGPDKRLKNPERHPQRASTRTAST
jgi:hypothetical protein